MTLDPLGRIWPCSGSGSLSGQYMIHGASGSLDTFCTRPPILIARPDGVSSGYGLLARGPIAACAAPRGRGEGGCASDPGELCVREAALSPGSEYGWGVEKPVVRLALAEAEAETAKRGERRAMGGAR